MLSQSAREEAKLNAMQRAWQTKIGLGSTLFDDAEELLTVAQSPGAPMPSIVAIAGTAPISCGDDETEASIWEGFQDQTAATTDPIPSIDTEDSTLSQTVVLDASTTGDFPARYVVSKPASHQMVAVGVYVDPRIVPGFKYRVRPLPSVQDITGDGKRPLGTVSQRPLFNGQALRLTSIGRGYARRFTFSRPKIDLNSQKSVEELYFWSDNRPEGYAFELELVSEGDRFTIFDTNGEAQGTVEVLKLEDDHNEISSVYRGQVLEKRANVKFTGKVEFYETGVAKPMPLCGVVVAHKRSRQSAEIAKVNNVDIQKHRYTLIPGVRKEHRRVTVKGEDINDVPTKYSMTGLEPHEMPVVGTYVDPRVIPGFHYIVRPNDRQKALFDGRALRLLSIGIGYAKRLTFEPDSLLRPDNYLWSDNHPDGLGLQLQVLHEGMKFTVWTGDRQLGEASVFRVDRPQVEVAMKKVTLADGKSVTVEKHVQVDVTCHVSITVVDGGTVDQKLMRVYGVAVAQKLPNKNVARVIRVEQVGLDSQLNVLFAQSQQEITFYPA